MCVCVCVCVCVSLYIWLQVYQRGFVCVYEVCMYVCMCIWYQEYLHGFVWVYVKVKLVTIVEGNPKAPFSKATTPRCRGGRYSFPELLYFTLDPYLIMLSVKQGGIKYHFLSLWYDSTWD